MTTVNLIPVPRLVARRKGMVIRRWAWVCAAYGAALVGAYGGVAAAWDYDRDGLQQMVEHESERNDKRNSEVRRLELDVEKARANLEANRAVGDQPDWSIMLRMIGKLGEGLVVLRECQVEPLGEPTVVEPGKRASSALTNIDMQPTKYQVRIHTAAKDIMAVTAFAEKLRSAGLFDRVDIVDSKREAFMAETALMSRLECVLTGTGRAR